MRIARVLTRLNLGGPARQVLASDPVLRERGHRVVVFTGRPERGEGDLADQLRAGGIEVREVPGLRRGLGAVLRDDRRARRFLEAAFAELQPDVVHTHASKAGVIGRAAARRACPGAGRVHTFHGHVLEGYFPAPVSAMLIRVERKLARSTHRILAVSEATRADLVRLGVAVAGKIQVCPPGIRLDPFLHLALARGASGAPAVSGEKPTQSLRRAHSIPRSAPVIGVIGRLAGVKRTVLAVEVFGAVAAEFPEARLLIAGDGGERPRVEARIAQLPPDMARRVHLLGALDNVVPVHEAIDVLLSTSSSEGMPVAMIEAAAAARPVVSTAVGGVPELVQNGITGLLAVDRDGLAAAVGGLLGDVDDRLAMGRRARTRVQERHSAGALADRLEAHYEEVLRSVHDKAEPQGS
ncbi:Alpha-monoglucosyldiacylglycerol synthase [Planctomycetes bacterium Poly30]|uniref:Alpha-monoglucosyldiacylglycerol synthase n=1 Tax=Saltatorellus ferox TaxID=2528018 RepID=A0A518ERR5_9BACT|nr:Alpha-monoglucosyldiacylglycerol synthase [Planctomycetes bacterium Poly30]